MVYPNIKLTPSFKLYGLAVVVMIAIAIITASALVLSYTKDIVTQRVLSERKQQLADKAQLIGQQVLFYRNIVKRLAKKQIAADILVFRNQDEALRWSADLRRRLPYIAGAALFTKRGRVLGNSQRQSISPASIATVRKFLRGVPISRPPIHHRRDGPSHIGLMAPVRDGGKIIGTVFISISLDSLQDSIKLLAKPGMSLHIRERSGQTILWAGDRDKRENTTKVSIAIPKTDWIVDLFQPEPELDDVYVAFGSITAMAVVIVTLLALVVLMFAVRMLTREYKTIQGLLRSVAKGQTPEDLPKPNIKEMAEVMPAIERMTRQIHNRQTELKELSLTDDLTGLPNRRHFQETLDRAIGLARRGMPVCVGLIDIDHFKQVNDTFGHDVGDKVLQTLAEVLQKHTRASDFAARIGGDEFAVVLFEMERPDAKDWFNRLRCGMRDRTMKEGLCRTDLPCTLSCGFTYIDIKKDVDTLMVLRKADKALYKGKAEGRNKVVGL